LLKLQNVNSTTLRILFKIRKNKCLTKNKKGEVLKKKTKVYKAQKQCN